MGNNTNKKKQYKMHYYRKKQKHMVELVKKRKQMASSPEASEISEMCKRRRLNSSAEKEKESSEVIFHDLQNMSLEGVTKTLDTPHTVCSSEFEQGNKEEEQSVPETVEDFEKFPELEVSGTHSNDKELRVGRRIICVSHFYKKLQEISNHGPLNCNLSHIDFVAEKVDGLSSKFTLLCRMCNLKFYIQSDSTEENYLPVNECAVAGIISIGGGHSNLQEMSSALNLPIISNKKYQKIHDSLSKSWEEVAQESMDQAADKERKMAISQGRISKNGIPVIDVIVDGCYSKRSYKTNYSALSGAGTIIGRQTGEVLYYGVKNKYCFS